MVFIRPFNLHMRQSLTTDFHFCMYSLFIIDKVLRHVFTGTYKRRYLYSLNSFAPIQWKRSTLKTLVYCSYLICSNDHYLTLELLDLQKVFKEYNNYPHWFITQVFNDVNKIFNQQEVIATNETTTVEESNSKKEIMKLPYACEKGCSIIKSLKKHLKKTLLANIEADIIYTGTELSSQLNNIKDPTPLEEQHDLIYHSVCNNDNCDGDYIGEIP